MLYFQFGSILKRLPNWRVQMKNEILDKTNVFEIYKELLEHESSYIVVVAGKENSEISISSNGMKSKEIAEDFANKLISELTKNSNDEFEKEILNHPLFTATQFKFKAQKMIIAFMENKDYIGYIMSLTDFMRDL